MTCFYIGPYIKLGEANCFISEREIKCVGLKQYRHDARITGDAYSALAIGLTVGTGGIVVTSIVNENIPLDVVIDSARSERKFKMEYGDYIEDLKPKFELLEVKFGIVPFYCGEQEAIWYGSNRMFAE